MYRARKALLVGVCAACLHLFVSSVEANHLPEWQLIGVVEGRQGAVAVEVYQFGPDSDVFTVLMANLTSKPVVALRLATDPNYLDLGPPKVVLSFEQRYAVSHTAPPCPSGQDFLTYTGDAGWCIATGGYSELRVTLGQASWLSTLLEAPPPQTSKTATYVLDGDDPEALQVIHSSEAVAVRAAGLAREIVLSRKASAELAGLVKQGLTALNELTDRSSEKRSLFGLESPSDEGPYVGGVVGQKGTVSVMVSQQDVTSIVLQLTEGSVLMRGELPDGNGRASFAFFPFAAEHLARLMVPGSSLSGAVDVELIEDRTGAMLHVLRVPSAVVLIGTKGAYVSAGRAAVVLTQDEAQQLSNLLTQAVEKARKAQGGS